jgi:hypothetical protein
MDKVIDAAEDAYNNLKFTGPAEHQTQFDVLARHEMALQVFVKREMKREANSLQAVDEPLAELKEFSSTCAIVSSIVLRLTGFCRNPDTS